MKRFLFQLLRIVICSALIVCILFCAIVLPQPDIFNYTYQNTIQAKYDVLCNTDEPKLIIIGGSNAGFGINESRLEELTGYKVANLGLHAGFGAIVPMELSRANINPGDIVLLAYEWDWFGGGYFDFLGTNLVMSAFGSRMDMYSRIPARFYPRILGNLFDYAKTKNERPAAGGAYARSAFDEVGRMTFERPAMIMPYAGNEATYGTVDVSWASSVDDKTETYLKEYKQFVNDQGAEVYMVCSPFYKGALACDISAFDKVMQLAEEEVGITFIGDPAQYAFGDEYMYDTIFHCNSAGEKHRSELLANDLISAGIIEK